MTQKKTIEDVAAALKNNPNMSCKEMAKLFDNFDEDDFRARVQKVDPAKLEQDIIKTVDRDMNSGGALAIFQSLVQDAKSGKILPSLCISPVEENIAILNILGITIPEYDGAYNLHRKTLILLDQHFVIAQIYVLRKVKNFDSLKEKIAKRGAVTDKKEGNLRLIHNQKDYLLCGSDSIMLMVKK